MEIKENWWGREEGVGVWCSDVVCCGSLEYNLVLLPSQHVEYESYPGIITGYLTLGITIFNLPNILVLEMIILWFWHNHWVNQSVLFNVWLFVLGRKKQVWCLIVCDSRRTEVESNWLIVRGRHSQVGSQHQGWIWCPGKVWKIFYSNEMLEKGTLSPYRLLNSPQIQLFPPS